MDIAQKALLFQALHVGADALLLPNAWDAVSARIMEQAGFPAIATASAAIALCHGTGDGEQMTADEMVRAVGRIAKAVSVPVSADIERGYGPAPNDVAHMVSRIIDAGAVGINIEDSLGDHTLRPAAEMAARIAAAHQVGEAKDVELYINARIDACLTGMGGDAAFEEITARAKVYLDAGASGIFVITADQELIARLARAVHAPLNVLVMDAGSPSVQAMSGLGVRRISTGPRLLAAMMGHLRADMSHLHDSGRFDVLEGMLSHEELDASS